MIRIKKDPTVGMNGFFSRQLDNYFGSLPQVHSPTDRIIRPSEMTDCTRQIVCKLLGFGVYEKITPRQQRIFDNGHYVHKRYLTSYLPRLGCLAKYEKTKKNGEKELVDFVEITLEDPELWVKGTPDAVIINLAEGLPYVFELKSIKHSSFMSLERPDWGYVAQVHMYMHLTGIPRSLVYYESKDTQENKEFIIPFEQSTFDLLKNKIQLVQKYVLEYPTTQALPEPCKDKWCVGCNPK